AICAGGAGVGGQEEPACQGPARDGERVGGEYHGAGGAVAGQDRLAAGAGGGSGDGPGGVRGAHDASWRPHDTALPATEPVCLAAHAFILTSRRLPRARAWTRSFTGTRFLSLSTLLITPTIRWASGRPIVIVTAS